MTESHSPAATSSEAPLAGRVALVTGGGRGQGRSHALALAAAGTAVVVCDAPEPMHSLSYPLATGADIDETVRLVEGAGGTCIGVRADVRRPDDVARAVTIALDAFGRLDILLANAGIAGHSKLWDVTDEAWAEMVDTNLTGVFHCLRAVIPTMRSQQFGRIVVTASMAARMGIPNIAHYAATKWGVIGMAKSLALEVAREGITVNVVCPCTVATDMVLNETTFRLFAPDLEHPTPDDIEARFRAPNPVPAPWIQPADVTRAVMYLVTDPGVLTGTVLEVSLGSSARLG